MIVIDMDMPKSCEECPCFDNVYGECQIDPKNTIGIDVCDISNKCPIKCDIEDIKAEILGLMSHDDYMVDGMNIIEIIDRHCGKEQE